jgi:hypothetical protein
VTLDHSEFDRAQQATFFFGNLYVAEVQWPEDILVEGIVLHDRRVALALRGGRSVDVAFDAKVEVISGRIAPLRSRGTFAHASDGRSALWTMLHFHLGATGSEMPVIAPNLHFSCIRLRGPVVSFEVQNGHEQGDIVLPLADAAQNAGLPMDLAEMFARHLSPMRFSTIDDA